MSHSNLPLPRFALTMGDPAGIGPEITLKALASAKLPKDCEIVVIGDMNVLEHRVNLMTDWPDLHSMTSIDDYKTGCINVLDMKQISVADFETGKPQAACGKAAYSYVVRAIDLCMEQKLCGMITCPISKEALHLAGIPFIGHTEILVNKTGVVDFSMLFALDNVYVVHVTTHVSVRNAVDLITCDTVLSHIRLLKQTLDSLGKENPRIAVAGLNPHAGENGLFGTEETDHIIPAIRKAQSLGMNVTGPFPPDTVFMRAFKGEFDGVVSMLHDHGFVALKSQNFDEGVHITVGLPIIRTSVGHGTAFDIAGKGLANETSLLGAIRAALLLWNNRHVDN